MAATGGRRRTAAAVVLLTLAGTILAFAPAAVSAHLVLACGTDLSTPNSSYTLTGSTVCPAGAPFGIEITANNVALNCAGWGILDPHFSATGTGIIVGPSVNTASVSHCLVKGFSNGVSVSSSTAVTLSHINAYPDPRSPGLGVAVLATTASTLNRVAVFGFQTGFQVSGACSGTALSDDKAQVNLGDGFFLTSLTGATFTGDKASANKADGFDLSSVTNIPVSGSTANTNIGDGFYVTGGSGETLTGDTASSNHANGFHLDSTASDLITGGASTGNRADGYFLDTTVTATSLAGPNTAAHNFDYGYVDQSSGAAGAPTYSTANTYNPATDCYNGNILGGTSGSISGVPAQPGCF